MLAFFTKVSGVDALMDAVRNGSISRLLYWLLGVLFILLVSVGSYAFNALAERISSNSTRIYSLEQISALRSERLAVVESKLSASEFLLERMEGKLDKVLETVNRKR